jgi:hypothetical protein
LPNQALGIDTKTTVIQIVAGETKSAGKEGLFNGILPPVVPDSPIFGGGVITIQTSQVENSDKATIISTDLQNTTSKPTLKIDRKLDLNDPYECGGYIYGNIISDTIILANMQIEFTQDDKVAKIYSLRSKDDGAWKQLLDDLPYGKYSYKVLATYEELTDTESFEIEHKSLLQCQGKTTVQSDNVNTETIANTVRTGGNHSYSVLAITTIVFLGLISLPVGRPKH